MDYKMVMLLLINAAVYGKKIGVLSEMWEEIDWVQVKEESYQHNCLAIIFPAIQRIQDTYECIDEDLYNQWEEEVVAISASQCIKNFEINNVIEKLKVGGVEVALFKGPILATLYPEHLLRVSGDMDLLCKLESEESAIEILKGMGYVVNQAESKKNVTVLEKGGILTIELHASLWEDYEGEHIDKLKLMGIEDSSKFIDFEGCDVKCKTLDVTNQFQYIFYHIVKHFIPGGVGMRHLIDISLFYNKYEKDIDIELFSKNMDTLGYTTFYKSIFSLCIAHFGMKNTCLDDGFILEAEVYQRLLDDVIDAGVFGNKTLERVKSRNIVKDTYYNSGTNYSKTKLMLNTMFPSAEALSDRYVNAKKWKVLLPVAWVQRAVYYAKNKVVNGVEPNVKKKALLVEERMELLRSLGL